MKDATYQRYYVRKKAEGKSGRLILSNLSNKLLRVVCVVIREDQPCEVGYRSIHTNLLKAA